MSPQAHPALSEAEQARRANRPVRDPDPKRNAAYWARIDAIVAAAPPLDDYQRAVIRTAFSTLATRTPPATSEATSAGTGEAA
ncbi:hypothetical protein [Streptomyces sp. AMCC400023]|uniref:hypothetical protein n=1 Tax=Streptomyces sp. AMCC400023 TaxID=2056258 RepID=UPI001F30C201|nr:hypothetical protein [Streptomyces sp. AMCC400023]